MQPIIEQIHAAPTRLVLEFAGAGSLGLWWLHSVGGSSRTILEATDRYALTSLSSLLGHTPNRAVSVETAIEMAARARSRAMLLHLAERKPHEPAIPILGVSCTATIASDYAKRGTHRGVVAVQHATDSTAYALNLIKGLRDRVGEEYVISQLLIRAIARACGIRSDTPLDLDPDEVVEEHHQMATTPLARLIRGDARTLTIHPDGRQVENESLYGPILSGSFNPLHTGHVRLAEVAAAMLNAPAIFELPITNADKGTLIAEEIERRLEQFAKRYTMVLSRVALFTDKAALYPGCTFVVGYDTALRLVAPRYYGGAARMHYAMDHIREAGCRFLVAGRVHQGLFQTLDSIEMPASIRDLFIPLSEELFRVDLSSTEIREAESEE
ncbi:MAG: hypothetical protein HC876_09735 [Chloroflexaceae bacterium]|nr:hypothetical protein [Chloroflexaceae bacterium]NJO05767.1 hypothetical protein [Chloroflexaceae bacterium]